MTVIYNESDEYDQRKALGQEYHRNGVSGAGFWTWVLGDRLFVEFPGAFIQEIEQDGRWMVEREDPTLIAMSLDIIRLAAEREPDEDGIRVAVRDTHGLVVLEGPDNETMVALHASPETSIRTAVFSVASLPDVRFGFNSWRGDHYHDRVVRALARYAPQGAAR